MSIMMGVPLVLLLCAAAPTGFERIQSLQREGSFHEAVVEARLELDARSAEAPNDSLAQARAMGALADALRLAGAVRGPEAIELGEHSLRIREAALGPSDPEVATVLSVLGRLRMARAETELARPLLERALRIRLGSAADSTLDVAQSLSEIGTLELQERHPDEALVRARAALDIRRRLLAPEHPDIAASLNLLANAFAGRGDFAEAESLLTAALEMRERTLAPDHPDVAATLHALGNLHIAQARFEDAIEPLERALAIRENRLGPNHLDLAATLNALGLANKKRERYDLAIPYYERAIDVAERAGGPEHPYTAMFLNNLAGVRWMLGSFDEALALTQRALAIREKALPPDHPEIVQSLQSLGVLFETMGRMDEAEVMFRRALEMLEKRLRPDHPDVIVLVSRLGACLTVKGALDEARPLLARAVRDAEAVLGPNHLETGQAYGNRGALERDEGRYAEAERDLRRCLEIRAQILESDSPQVGYALIELGDLDSRRGLPELAVEKFLRAEEMGRRSLERSMGSLSEDEALTYDALRGGGLGFALETVADHPEVSRACVAAVWDALVRSRSVVLDVRAWFHRRAHLAEDDESVALRDRHARAQSEFARCLVQGAREGRAAAADSALVEARREVEAAERALAGAMAVDPSRLDIEQAGFTEIRAALPDSSALLAYVRSSEERPRLLAFVLAGKAREPELVSLGDVSRIDELVTRWRTAVARGEVGGVRAQAAEREAGRALREAVWDPLARRLPPLHALRFVHVVPDGTLDLVNFSSLPVGTSGYLVEERPAIHLASTERDLLGSPDPASPGGLLAFGDPDFDSAPVHDETVVNLPASPADVQDHARVRGQRARCPELDSIHWERLPGSAREARETFEVWARIRGASDDAPPAILRTGAAASESNFIRLAPGSRVVHVATHGFFLGGSCGPSSEGTRGIGGLASSNVSRPSAGPSPNGVNPFGSSSPSRSLSLSGLVLAGANLHEPSVPGEDDGILTAEEITALDLRDVDWVVLSACDTGVGELRASGGVFGLRRAFRLAGARTLVMSLWPVEDDMARRWMSELYRARLEERCSTAESVRAANRSLLRERRAANQSTSPFFWGGFVASGDWR